MWPILLTHSTGSTRTVTNLSQPNPRFVANSAVYMSFDGFNKFLNEVGLGKKVIRKWTSMQFLVLLSLTFTDNETKHLTNICEKCFATPTATTILSLRRAPELS